MYRNTRFSELIKGLPRGSFQKIVNQQCNDKYSKGFSSWDQLIAMVYAQVSGSRSLRELEAGFNSQTEHHYHLGTRKIKRSTLADANTKRGCELFQYVCNQLMSQAHRQVRGELKDLLYLIDSSPISLKVLGYDDWTKDNHSHRTQGLKVHMQYAPASGLPVHIEMAAPNINDVEMGRQTVLEENASVAVVSSKEIFQESEGVILKDEEVSFKTKRPGKGRTNLYHGTKLRRITVNRPDKETPLIVATNDFERSAEDIAALYKKRWVIELFFKWLKQNLKIKQFLGRSENAVKIQVYTALISYLLAYSLKERERKNGSMKLWFAELRSTLFRRTELESYLAKKRRNWQQEYQHLQGNLAI